MREKRISKRLKRKARSRAWDFDASFANFKPGSYKDILDEIRAKIGERPPLPKDYPKGVWSPQALRVLEERYLLKDENGKVVETPEEMCWRVAWEVASSEARWGKTRQEVKSIARDFYKLLISHEFLPNSPTLMNAGTGNGLQYSACFVLPVEDSIEGIFDALKYQALIHKSGGGTGFAFSRLRPKGSRVRSSSGTASGPVSFMRVFDAATNEVKQGGKRRGANMGILRVDHPDILEFIHCKEDGGITNFNISVAITDEFMLALEKGEEYQLRDPRNGEVVGKLSARKVFEEIAQAAWRTGDPGLVFIDRQNESPANPVPDLGPIEATNPCGEQPLYPFDACNLGSIFLTYFVDKKRKDVDWERLKKVTKMAVRFLDDVIEVNPYPLEQIRKTVFAIRRIGLGVGGWADMLIELGIPYNSYQALDLAEKVMKFIQEEAVAETQALAEERGPFPLWRFSIYSKDKPRRNSTVTTIAPTGTISIIANASSGIEPLFAVAYQHIVKDKHIDRKLTFFNPKFEEIMKRNGIFTEEIRNKVAEKGVIQEIKEIPEEIRKIFITAHEIDFSWHVKMQAAFQKYTENAVSKTINMPHHAQVDDIREAYSLSWKTNCKGITVFRDGCKSEQVLNLGIEKTKQEELIDPLIPRPFGVKGITYRVKTSVGTAFITLNQNDEGEPFEVFINIGKAGSDVSAMAHALARTISVSLRFRDGVTPKQKAKEIAEKLEGISGRRVFGFGANKILSLPDAVAYVLTTHFGFKLSQDSRSLAPGNGEFNNGQSNGESSKHFELGAKPDLAGAVMLAQSPAQQDFASSENDDHTTASAESGLAPREFPEQLSLNHVAYKIGDICPSCGASSFVYEEGCSKCFSCGYSEC